MCVCVCVFLLFQILFYLSFLFFKLWKYDSTFSGDLENTEQTLHIVLLYIAIIYFSGEKLKFSVEVSISSFQKLIEWMYRKVEEYSRPEKHYEPTQHS